MKLYVNNVLDSSQPLNTSIKLSDYNVTIGNGRTLDETLWTDGFPGVIDDLRIYPGLSPFAVPAQAAI